MEKILIYLIVVFGWTTKALAVTNPAEGFFVTSPGTTVPEILDFIISTLLGLLGLVAMLFIIIGGYQYIFSGANEDLAEKGKKTLTNAIIGLVIAILSYVILKILVGTLGGS